MENENKNVTLEENIGVDPAVEHAAVETDNKKPAAYTQFLLPGAILLAALIISGTLFYTKGPAGTGTAQIGNDQGGQQAGAPVKIDIGADDHILGNKDAKITIVEFADFRCPFCERFDQQSEAQLLKDYVNTGKARFVFRHFAFLGQQSTWVSEAAECASEQGKFWEYHNWLYRNQAPESDLNYYSKTNLVKYADKIGLDTAQFSSCINSDKYSKRVADNTAEGQKDGVSGTPTIFINGQKIVGAQPYANFQVVIDGLLKK